MNRVQRALALLRDALAFATRRNQGDRADRIRKAQADLARHPHVFPQIVAAREQSAHGPQHAVGMCLSMVVDCFGVQHGVPDAISSWNMSKSKHHESNPDRIPRGVPVFWAGGSAGHGHVAISAGNGMCWSTDIKRNGFFDVVPIEQIHNQWGLTLLGWTSDLNGQRLP
jgi:hypothetical protein